MSIDGNGTSPRWSRAIRREASDCPNRSEYIDTILAKRRRDQVERERLAFGRWQLAAARVRAVRR